MLDVYARTQMEAIIRPATEADIQGMLAIINDYAAQNLSLIHL